MVEAQNAGSECPGSHYEIQNCNTNSCKHKCANPSWIGDEECDASNNNALCDFDGGDCQNTAIDCRKGDGLGGNEVILNGKYTVEECVTEVQKQYPTANGASMNFDCPTKCSCYAEFDMNAWSGSKFQACFFREKNVMNCCDSIEVYYNGALEYTYESIYGYYVRQDNLINGRPWYKNGGKSIWWNVKYANWMLGKTTDKGGSGGYAYLSNNGRCLPKIPNQEWKITLDGSNLNDAENKVKVRCGYKPKGK